MNEDDTFRILKRIPFHMFDQILGNMSVEQFEKLMGPGDELEIFFNSHGWTIKEFLDHTYIDYDV